MVCRRSIVSFLIAYLPLLSPGRVTWIKLHSFSYPISCIVKFKTATWAYVASRRGCCPCSVWKSVAYTSVATKLSLLHYQRVTCVPSLSSLAKTGSNSMWMTGIENFSRTSPHKVLHDCEANTKDATFSEAPNSGKGEWALVDRNADSDDEKKEERRTKRTRTMSQFDLSESNRRMRCRSGSALQERTDFRSVRRWSGKGCDRTRKRCACAARQLFAKHILKS